MQRVADDLHIVPGRRDIDMVGLQHLAVNDFKHIHIRVPVQERGHHASMLGIQMLDNDKSHVGAHRQAGQHVFIRLQTTRRSADTNDDQVTISGNGFCCGGGFAGLLGFISFCGFGFGFCLNILTFALSGDHGWLLRA